MLYLSLIVLLYFPLFVEYCRQGGDDAPTTLYLFLGLFEYAMHKFKVQFAHPCGATLWCVGKTAVEIKGCAYGYLHAVLEVWLQALHELFLLWRAKGYPNDVGTVLFYHTGDAGVVKTIDGAEWQFLECHALYVGVLFGEVLLQGIEYVLLGTKEYHAVLAGADNVNEDVAAAVVVAVISVYPLYEFGYPTAVADGEDAAVNGGTVLRVAVYHGEYVAVGNANVPGLAIGDILVNCCVHCRHVEFVSYVEIFFHVRFSRCWCFAGGLGIRCLCGFVVCVYFTNCKFNNCIINKQF